MAAPKIIVLGSLNGNLEPAFAKLATLHSKNSFSLALLTGDVFGPSCPSDVVDALLGGTIAVPLPTYFSVGAHALPAPIAAKISAGDDEVCPNLHFLGRRSVTKTSEGLRIVTLGGAPTTTTDSSTTDKDVGPFHNDDDARSLKGAHSADILLTSASWPAGIWERSKLPPPDKDQVVASAAVAELCAALRPRYHLSASPGAFFYEREPFIQAATTTGDAVAVTRFISLAPYGNAAKQKALYAFTLNRSDDAVPPGATASPLVPPRDKKRPSSDNDDDDAGYSRYGHHGRQKRHQGRQQQRPPPGPEQCFFCLSNPRTATHMICSIGEDSYVTTAKGPLPDPSSSPIPHHFIIIPLAHAPTLSTLSTSRSEMTRFRNSLQSMLARHSLGAVTWEISRARNVHLIWQLVGLPFHFITDGLAEAALRVEADHHKYPAFQSRDLTEEEEGKIGDYVRVWLWGESDGDDAIRGKTLVMPLDADARFDLQFVRRALAKLLGLEKRAVWQDCQQTEEEETKDAEAFREAFKEWDFTLE